MTKYPNIIQNLIDEFSHLPGLGPKSAERLVFYLLKQQNEFLINLAGNITSLKKYIKTCSSCFNFTTKDPCEICSDSKRDKNTLCIVAQPQDLLVIEKTGEFNGLYHVLGGVLNPLENITPDKIRIKELINRLKNTKIKVKEVILALNPDLEGESTSIYLTRQLKPYKIKITRLAKGLPMGSDLEYADEVTVSNALKGRQQII